jgi:hypothetical protein
VPPATTTVPPLTTAVTTLTTTVPPLTSAVTTMTSTMNWSKLSHLIIQLYHPSFTFLSIYHMTSFQEGSYFFNKALKGKELCCIFRIKKV